ncbi:MarR family transcriptional regulator [bacterium SCSIO 12741]|nr:MarR family transcriptional regulator [bacterium SCSIO 12741]
MEKQEDYPLLADLDPTICLSNKMRKCNRIVANLFRKHLQPFGLSNSQLTLLFVIHKAPEVNQKKLADVLIMEKSTVNRNLQRLLDHNWVAKQSDQTFELTETGKALVEEIIPHWQAAMTEIRAILQEDGESALDLVLKKLTP